MADETDIKKMKGESIPQIVLQYNKNSVVIVHTLQTLVFTELDILFYLLTTLYISLYQTILPLDICLS